MRKLVLWGHHLDEYQEMFDLSAADMKTRLLEYGCGPSAVNVELTKQSQSIVSCDPLFMLDKDTLYSKADLIFADMAARIIKDKQYFDFSRYGGPSMLIDERREGMAKFFPITNRAKKKNVISASTITLCLFPIFPSILL